MPSTEENKYAPSAGGWGADPYLDLTVPSGQLCQVKRVNPRVLVALGLVDSVDPLTALVDVKHIKRVGSGPTQTREIDEKSLMSDPRALVNLLDIADKLCEAIIVQPPIKRPIRLVDGKEFDLQPHERVEGVIYTDMVDEMDKMFVFSWALGGSTDLEQFRERSEEIARNLLAVPEDEDSSIGVVGDNPPVA